LPAVVPCSGNYSGRSDPVNLKDPRLLLAVCLAALPLWAQTPMLQGPGLANSRSRLPESTGPAVACAMADLDGDGDQDLVRATSSAVIVATQDPSGRFVASGRPVPVPPMSTTTIQTLAVGQLGNNKSPDMLVAFRNGTCWVAVNDAQGKIARTFFLPPLKNVVRPVLHAVLVGNLDGLRGDDIVVVLNQLAPQVYLSNRSGGFDAPTQLSAPALLNPAAALLDIDQDKDLDLLLVTSDAKKRAQPLVYLNSTGKLGLPASGYFPSSLVVAARQVLAADINNNGRPEILFAAASTGSIAPAIYTRPSATSPLYSPQLNPGKFTIDSALAFVAADANSDGFVDLLALQADGRLLLGSNGGTSSPGVFAAAKVLLGGHCLAVADLEPDKDVDLVVGGRLLEDSLLLGDGKGGFLDTEDRGMPSAAHARHAGALVDATGEGDPDIALYDQAGKPTLLVNQNGQVRFRRDPLQVLPVTLPALPSGTYSDVQAAAVATTLPVDLLVLGSPLVSGQPGVRVLVRTRSGSRYFYRDDTPSRWSTQPRYVAMAVGDIGGHAAGSQGAKGYSDLVVLTTSGQLQLVLSNTKIFSVHKTVIASSVQTGSRILLGHVNGLQDQLLDIVLLQPTLGIRVFLGQSSPADTFKEGSAIKATPGVGLLADLTGDKAADLLIATSQTSQGLQVFQADGRGGFSDASSKLLPATGLKVTSASSLALVRSVAETRPAIAIGITSGADLLLRWSGSRLGVPEQLPFRGSFATQACLAGDLDLDGDSELVTLRPTTLPGVLLGQSLQLTQNSITQPGRSLGLFVRLPPPPARGLVGLSIQTTRVELPGFGILRLSGPIPILTVGPSATGADLLIPTPPSLAMLPIPAQLFVIDQNVLRIGNLDILEIN
jgi:hypothetical protein